MLPTTASLDKLKIIEEANARAKAQAAQRKQEHEAGGASSANSGGQLTARLRLKQAGQPAAAPKVTELDPAPVRICSVNQLQVGDNQCFNIHGRNIAVFRRAPDRWFALDCICYHMGAPLAGSSRIVDLEDLTKEMPGIMKSYKKQNFQFGGDGVMPRQKPVPHQADAVGPASQPEKSAVNADASSASVSTSSAGATSSASSSSSSSSSSFAVPEPPAKEKKEAVVCPWHYYIIGLETGDSYYQQMDKSWSSKGVKQRTHKVEVKDGDVWVTLTSGPRIASDDYAERKDLKHVHQ